MLVQFSVENFKSFNEKTTFSMLASDDDSHPNHVVKDALGLGKTVLRAAAIYGANGAGKSNLIEAIRVARGLILDGTATSKAIRTLPFKLSDEIKPATRFEFIFVVEEIMYSYGFSYSTNMIEEEWLFKTEGKEEIPFFERSNIKGRSKIVLGEHFPVIGEQSVQFLDFIIQGTRTNQLFLTEAGARNVTAVAPILSWFTAALVIIKHDSKLQGLEMMFSKDKNFESFVSSLLKVAGTGVERIYADEISVPAEQIDYKMPYEALAKLRSDAEAQGIHALLMNGQRREAMLLLDRCAKEIGRILPSDPRPSSLH